MNLNQVTIAVSNIERSIRFYEQLGLRLIVQAPNYARFESPAGTSTFSLHRTEGTISAGGTWIYFEVKDLDEHVNALIDKGMVFEEMPNDKSWLWRESRIADPDGHILILFFAGENRRYPPWRIVE